MWLAYIDQLACASSWLLQSRRDADSADASAIRLVEINCCSHFGLSRG